MNPLDRYPKVREALYIIQWITTGLTGALGVYFGFAVDGGAPQWYTVTVAILAFVWAYTGVTAQQNVPDVAYDNEEA